MSFIENISVHLIFLKLIEVSCIRFHISRIVSCNLTIEVKLRVTLGCYINVKHIIETSFYPHFCSNLDTKSRILVTELNTLIKLLVKSYCNRALA